MFQIDLLGEPKREERDQRNGLVSAPDQAEQEGEAFGDLVVFDYEKVQKGNKGKESFRSRFR